MIIVVLACILMPVWSTEPNEPNETKTKLYINSFDGGVSSSLLRGHRTPFGATYFAAVFIKGSWDGYVREGHFKRMLETSAGRKMGQLQRDLFSEKIVDYVDTGRTIGGYSYFRLFGAGKDEAEIMVKALLEDLTKRVRENLDSSKKRLQTCENELNKAKGDLTEKEAKLKELDKSYEQIKSVTHQFLTDDVAIDLAKKSVVEMDKTLNALDIELAGIREKLKTVEKYRNEPNLRDRDKLDEMHIELMIELSGLEARKKATEKIRRMEEEFLKLFNECEKLTDEVSKLKETIKTRRIDIEQLNNRLNNPTPEMQTPKVFNNEVTIYRVPTPR